MISERDKMHLGYFARATGPLWGGHLKRGEPLSDPDMQRWLDLGLIMRDGDHGYVITAKGVSELRRTSQ